MSDKETCLCSNCLETFPIDEIVNYEGYLICEGCAETQDMLRNSDDPHGKNWGE